MDKGEFIKNEYRVRRVSNGGLVASNGCQIRGDYGNVVAFSGWRELLDFFEAEYTTDEDGDKASPVEEPSMTLEEYRNHPEFAKYFK